MPLRRQTLASSLAASRAHAVQTRDQGVHRAQEVQEVLAALRVAQAAALQVAQVVAP